MPTTNSIRYRLVNETLKAGVFAAFIFCLFLAALVLIFVSEPIVLGTEMNTNGQIEYLCLGRGCENLTAMDW